MTKRLLILEPDETFVTRLVQALDEHEAYSATVASSAKDACLRLMQQSQDLAFIPVIRGEKIVRALRAVQPDLRLVVITPTADTDVPKTFSGKVQGVLLKSHLDADLDTVLNGALAQPFPKEETSADTSKDSEPALDTTLLIATLQKARLSPLVQSTVFAQGKRLLAHWGQLNGTEAATVALQAGEEWDDASSSVRIQFMHLPARAGDMLLYTRRLGERYLLTMVAMPETPVSELRVQAEPLIANLFDTIAGKRTVDDIAEADALEAPAGRKSFAIVWRPIRSLPTSLHIPLRRAIERLAVSNACVLTHIEVQSELVHLVVRCPPGRDSAWAAYLFKNGSEATIQQEFHMDANLWDTGYYATEANTPLSVTELNIFLGHIDSG